MRIKNRDSAYRWLRGHIGDDGRWRKGWNELHPESRVEADVKEQWIKGNRGNTGEWK